MGGETGHITVHEPTVEIIKDINEIKMREVRIKSATHPGQEVAIHQKSSNGQTMATSVAILDFKIDE